MVSMRNLFNSVIYVALLALLPGCASYHTKTTAKTTQKSPVKHGESKASNPFEGPGVYWELFSGAPLSLQLKNVDSGARLTVILDKGLSLKNVPAGHWELTGFEEKGKSFVSMNISKKFVFRVKPKSNVYAGSILVGCPKINPSDFKLLREMKFFDRYPFSSASGICEMVVGNDFAGVRKYLRKATDNKKLNLIMGF